jgi:hypothetical protein
MKDSAQSSRKIWVVRSSWDRWQPVGISGIDVSRDKEPPVLYS